MALDRTGLGRLHVPGSDTVQVGLLMKDLAAISRLVAGTGLVLRGAFHPEPADRVPALHDGRPAATLVLLGSVGGSLWPRFAVSEERRDGKPDPLDRWSRRVIGGLARDLGATALYPFGGPPFRPFVAWAKRAEGLRESPLGMLIHPDHGLWHAYRGALVLPDPLALPPRLDRPFPCEACPDKPCLRTCPVQAFGSAGYDVAACSGFLASGQGGSCREAGCLARRACPVGRHLCYPPEQAEFHMTAFQAARRAPRGS